MNLSEIDLTFIEELKHEIRSARIKASLTVNKELIMFWSNKSRHKI